MALRDQPYIPLYVQDIMTDEKLNECSASTHGIYIKGIMCLMHKSETYGKLLLKQKHKQNESKEYGMACQLVKHLPYEQSEIYTALKELIIEEVCYWDGDYFCQKRMIKDNDLSLKRAKAGKKGGQRSQEKKEFDQANLQANSEIENEIENEDINKDEIELNESQQKTIQFICDKFGISEMKQFQNYRIVYSCVVCQFNQGEELFKHFKDQCWNYFMYKNLSQEKIHSFKSFIGTPEDKYNDGGWNANNWIKKHTDLNNKEKGIESKVDKDWNRNKRKNEQPLANINIKKID
jgi:hypothetical protein